MHLIIFFRVRTTLPLEQYQTPSQQHCLGTYNPTISATQFSSEVLFETIRYT